MDFPTEHAGHREEDEKCADGRSWTRRMWRRSGPRDGGGALNSSYVRTPTLL
jgi:hypothetical protein